MLSKKAFLFILLLGLVLAACASGGAEAVAGVSEAPMEREETADFDTAASDVTGFSTANDAVAAGEQQAQATQERLIILTADLNIVVADTEATVSAITEMVVANGGWVVDSSLYQYGENAKSGNITVRVPVEGFNSSITAIKSLAVEVTSENASGQDVTEEFVDLSSRLENLEATAARVRNFLDEAKDVQEALAVNQELSRLEGEIEVIKGRMQYLSQSSSFSTITVNLTPDIAIQPIAPATWRPGVVAREALETLVNALQGVANLAIVIAIVFVPMALLFGLPLWLIIRYVRQRRRGTAPVATD
jgi:hypothetical protein